MERRATWDASKQLRNLLFLPWSLIFFLEGVEYDSWGHKTETTGRFYTTKRDMGGGEMVPPGQEDSKNQRLRHSEIFLINDVTDTLLLVRRAWIVLGLSARRGLHPPTFPFTEQGPDLD